MPRTPRLLLLAIGLVLTAVSLRRLHVFAVYENERDAVRVLRSMGTELGKSLEQADAKTELGLQSHAEAAEASVLRLTDVEWLSEGRFLRRHGYLFDLSVSHDGTWWLRAWPWQHGRTGFAAFAIGADGSVFGHPNRDAVWSGLVADPRVERERWLELERRDA